MMGGNSIQLARVFGVRIGVDFSWFLVLFLVIFSLSGYYKDALPGAPPSQAYALAVASALLFFLCIVLHELGHAWASIRNGIAITGIDLWLFGGVAKMARDTQSPGVEFRVAVAGPLVTLLLMLSCGAIGISIEGADRFWAAMRYDPVALNHGAIALLAYLTSINALVLAFNLIPAFPLDGGRITRAIAWKVTGDRSKGTRFAAMLGQGFSFLMIGGGLFLMLQGSFVGGLWLAFIGFFLGNAARGTAMQTAVTSRLEGKTIQDVMDAEPVAIPESLNLEDAYETYFLRYGYPWFPVVDAAGRFVGLLDSDTVEKMPEAVRQGRTVAGTMSRDDAGSLTIAQDQPLEALLGSEALRRIGALMAVDADRRLRGIVTVDDLRKVLQGPGPATAPQ